MKRTTVSLPDDVAAAIEREAARRRVSVSQVVREALEDRLGWSEAVPPRDLPFIGMFESGLPGMAEHTDDVLREHWADAIDRDR